MVAEEAKEKGFPETAAASAVGSRPSAVIVAVDEVLAAATAEALGSMERRGVRALETSTAEALHDLDRNSIGSCGISGSRIPPAWEVSGRRVPSMGLGTEKGTISFIIRNWEGIF